ncbi:hypothetical protein GCM10009647_058060 [Streptomyces sanglieri]
MVPVEDLGHDAPLRSHAPAASAKSFQQVTHRNKPNSEGTRSRTGVTLDVHLTWTKSIVGSAAAYAKGQAVQFETNVQERRRRRT